MDRDGQEWRPQDWTVAQVLSPSVSTSDLLESGRVPLSLEFGPFSHPTGG